MPLSCQETHLKLISYFHEAEISNTYIVGPDDGGSAILIDPGHFNESLFTLIEENHFDISGVLITHTHSSHDGGLRTLLRVYNGIVIVAGNTSAMDYPSHLANYGSRGTINGLEYEVLPIAGFSEDSRIYKIGSYIFTGDMIFAGRIGYIDNTPELKKLRQDLQNHLLSLNDDFLLLPGHGPPSTIRAERKYNADLKLD